MSDYQVPAGNIAVTTNGSITVETTQALLDMQAHAHKLGLQNIKWNFIIKSLVDKARNDAVQALLGDPNLKWLWFLDADMMFQPQLIELMLQTAFSDCTWADIVGGYCQLRGEPFIPTIDTGTGTWEPTLPGQGSVEVMRTGSACILIKRHVFEALEPPWYGVRPTPRAIDMMLELDNYARTKFDARNPFMDQVEWEQLLQCAREDAVPKENQIYGSVGEDSNFCDHAKALGFRIIVNTNAVVGHVDRKVIWPQDHVDALKKIAEAEDAAAGIIT